MAPAQRTFTIVPNPLGMQGLKDRPAGEDVPRNRPMTSKQAQKLHKQATRVPKLSKAEEVKRTKELQKQIREEDDKRRQSNKARMLRDRKKEKEQKVIDVKKRKGLPIVDVRPSQGLITRMIVRGNGTGKKRDSPGAPLNTVREESPACDSAKETTADEETDQAAEDDEQYQDVDMEALADVAEEVSNPAKRLRTDSPVAGKPRDRAVQSPRRSQRASFRAVAALRLPDADFRVRSIDVDDSAIEDILRTQILEDSTSAANGIVLQQRSGALNTKVGSAVEMSPGKENIPPVLSGKITLECTVKEPSPQPPLARRALQRGSTADVTAAAQRESPGPRQAMKSPKSRASPIISSRPPARDASQNPPHPRPAIQAGPHAETSRNAHIPSRFETDLIEAPKTCTEPTVSAPPGPSGHRPSEGKRPKGSAERRPLQRTVATSRAPAGDGFESNGAMKPPRPPPVTHVLKPVPTVVKHYMLPPPPPSNSFKRPAQVTSRRNFPPRHINTPLPGPLVAHAAYNQATELKSIASESTLPTSTQLFVLSHLDDILPSPSQEARELRETAPRPPISRPQPPLWRPPPRFPARGAPGAHPLPSPQLPKFGSHAPKPRFKAPLPKQPASADTPVLLIRQTIEPALPFFSTQDFMLSSQDIRDLEDTTETPSKLRGGKEASIKTSAIPESRHLGGTASRDKSTNTPTPNCMAKDQNGKRAEQYRGKVATQQYNPGDCSQFSHSSRYALRKSQPRTPICSAESTSRVSQTSHPRSQATVKTLNPVLSNPSLSHIAVASQRSPRSSPLARSIHNHVTDTPSLKPASPKPSASASTEPPRTVSTKQTKSAPENILPPQQTEPHAEPATPQPSASPQRGRFFTASNEAIQLAMEKSMRTHKEEQRKREAEQRALDLLERKQVKEEERRRVRQERQDRKLLTQLADEEDDDDLGWRSPERRSDGSLAEMQCVVTDGCPVDGMEVDERPLDHDDLLPRGYPRSVHERGMEETTWRRRLQEEQEKSLPAEPAVGAKGGKHGKPCVEDADSFGMEADLEEELLGMNDGLFDGLDAVTCPPDMKRDIDGREQHGKFAASQETDYGDLDVTMEDLDEYF